MVKGLRNIITLVAGICLLLISYSAGAQEVTHTRAKLSFDMKDYEAAEKMYEQLYKKEPRNNEIYSEYLEVLLVNKEYKKARRIVDEQLELTHFSPVMYIDMGRVYIADGKEKKAEEQFNLALQSISGDDMLTQHMAQKFMEIERDDYALKTYERAGQILNNHFIYSGPMSRLYFKTGDLERAITTLLDASHSFFNGGIDEVKSTLLEYVGDDRKKISRAQKALIKKINEQPDNRYYSELLTWLYTQKGDWEGALMQVRALDEKYKEQGERILEFARYAVKEGENEFAIKAYNEMLEKGESYPFYSSVVNEVLGVKLKLLEENPDFTQEQVKALEKEFASFFEKYPQYYGFPVVQDYARLLAQFAGKPNEAIAVLEKAIEQPQTRKDFRGQCKLQLGDYYILIGKVWDASLIYSQVDKEFREDMLGEDARYRNAKVAYYMGDFDWANGQLSVLKASTSELIANDALYLSVLITENIPADSNLVPLKRFAYADLLLFQNKDKEAEQLLDSISTTYPEHPLKDDILMLRAKIASKHRDYTTALDYYKEVHEKHGKDVLGDDALFKMAEIYEQHLDDKKKAGEIYAQLILEYPGSTYIQLARKKVKELDPQVTL